MNIIGIDPGLDGGLAVVNEEGINLRVMPTLNVGKKRELDAQQVVDWLRIFACKAFETKCHVVIESVSARPGQGVVSMFSFGTGWGMLRGICAGIGLPYTLVRPQEWQGLILKGQPKGAEYRVASQLWPDACWLATERCTVAHSGLVDAALIAEYGRRTLA